MPHTVFLTEHYTNLYKGIFSGACGGAVISVIGQPFDNVKFRLQTNTMYKGMIDCFSKMIRVEGISSLFKGLSLTLPNQILFRSSLFLTQGETKKYLLKYDHNENNKNKIWHYFAAGSIGWAIGSVIECPFDVVRLQLQKNLMSTIIIPNYVPQFTNVYNCINQMWKQNKLKTFYMGFSSHIIRNIFAGGIHLGTYDIIREKIANYKGVDTIDIKIHENLFAGALSGVFFWSAIYPLDVIKSNLQSDHINKNERLHRNMFNCATHIYKVGGVKSFYKGLAPCVLRAIPANSLMLYVVTITNEKLLKTF